MGSKWLARIREKVPGNITERGRFYPTAASVPAAEQRPQEGEMEGSERVTGDRRGWGKILPILRGRFLWSISATEQYNIKVHPHPNYKETLSSFLSLLTSSSTRGTDNMLGCHLLGVVWGTLPLLSHQLRKVRGISIQPLARPMAFTSFLFASPLLGPSVLRLRSCSPAFVSGTIHTHGSKNGWRMFGCSAGSPLLVGKGLLSSLSVGSCRSLVGNFRVSLVACVTWLVS